MENDYVDNMNGIVPNNKHYNLRSKFNTNVRSLSILIVI